MPGMFDDIIADMQGEGPTPRPPQPAAPLTPAEQDPGTARIVGMANAGTLGQLPRLGGVVQYAIEGGAEGAYGRGEEKVNRFITGTNDRFPDEYTEGKMEGGALLGAVPAGKVVQGLRAVPGLSGMAIRGVLNAMGFPVGRAAEVLMEGAQAVRPLTQAIRAGQQAPATAAARPLAQAIRGERAASARLGRMGNVSQDTAASARVSQMSGGPAPSRPGGYQGTGDPFSGPAPNASIRTLSPEMQAKSDAYQAFLRRYNIQ